MFLKIGNNKNGLKIYFKTLQQNYSKKTKTLVPTYCKHLMNIDELNQWLLHQLIS
jgi:hypothetical protein